jgi:hypothetical protein
MNRSREARKTPTARMAKISPGEPRPASTGAWAGGGVNSRAFKRPPLELDKIVKY